MKRLLIRADDFGMSAGTNVAILEAARAGLVRNVGIMAPAPGLLYRLDELRAMRERVCLGLHATLNSEWESLRWGPVAGASAVPGLTGPDGTFHRKVEHTHRLGSPREGVLEVREQLAKLRRLGVEPQYLDCHMCFNWDPDWDRAMGEFAEAEGLVYHAHAMLPSVRLENPDPAQPLASQLLSHMQASGMETAIWVLHPARRDEDSMKFDQASGPRAASVAASRERDYRILTDPAGAQSVLASDQIRLIRYDELATHC